MSSPPPPAPPRVWIQVPGAPEMEVQVERLVAEFTTQVTVRSRTTGGETIQCRSRIRDEAITYSSADPDRSFGDHLNAIVQQSAQRIRAERQRQAAERSSPWTQWSVTGTTTYQGMWQAGWANAATPEYQTPVTIASANVVTVPITPEQEKVWRDYRARVEAVEAKRRVEQAAADKLAEELLADLIGTHKYRIWRKNGYIRVSSKKYRSIRYEIRVGHMIQLHQRTKTGWRKRKDQLCIHPYDRHPRGDEAAALYALASFDEDTLWKVANHHDAALEPALAA